MSERDTELVAIPKPSALGGAVLRGSRLVEQAAGSVLGPVEQLATRIAADIAQAVVAQIDVDAILERIDVDGLIRRVDVDGIVARVDLDALMARVDLDALMARVDVDAIVRRVDIDGVMARVDLSPVVERVLDDVDIGAIVVESTGSITGGVVDSVRMQAIMADRFVARVVDLLLLRRWRDRRTSR